MEAIETDAVEVAGRLATVDQAIKKLEKEKGELRSDLFSYATRHNAGEVLRTQIVTLPMGFFNKVKVNQADYFARRFPAWIVKETRTIRDEEAGPNEGEIEYLLEENPDYKPFMVEAVREDGKRVALGKTVQNNSPDLDGETLALDDKAAFDFIYRPRIVYELDANAFEQYITENPEKIPVIERNMIVPPPTKKLMPVKVLKDEVEDG